MNMKTKGLANPNGFSLSEQKKPMGFNDYLTVMFSDFTFEDYLDLMMSSDQPQRNATEEWLFSAKSTNYERLWKKITTNRFDGKFKINPHDVQDYLQSYIIEELIEKDLLAPHLEEGKKVNLNAIKHWFVWYVQRERYKEGRDCHNRARGARTQAEVQKIQEYENDESSTPYAHAHNIKNLESEGFKVAKVLRKVDKDTGSQVGDTEFFVPNNYDDLVGVGIEERSENDHMKKLLLKRFGSDRVEYYYTLWMELRYEVYRSKTAWARAWNTTTRLLVKDIDKVKSVFIQNRADFGH